MEPKFKIGDYLQMISERKMKESILASNKNRIPNSFGEVIYVVVGILVDYCYGGVQVHYHVRPTFAERFGNIGIAKEILRVSEPELEPWKPEESVA